ncbi:MAG: TlpA disulfide reductase family protein [Vicinamibacterales bacterium]
MRAHPLVLTCLVLAVGCGRAPAPAAPADANAAPAPATAEETGFPPVPPVTLEVGAHTDEEVDALIASLQRLVSGLDAPETWAKDASLHFWRLQNRIERKTLTDPQAARVATAIRAMAEAHPADRDYLEHRAWMAEHIGVGRVAPDIQGTDLDGAAFTLGETRGKVTVLVFTGEWCGPCRSEYPYQRLLLELYADRPFALVGVNSDPKLETAKQGKIDSRLPYRSWWDGNQEENTRGPIATAWGVTGWPTIYILDAKGVIRFAGMRHEDTLKAVSQLMQELPRETTSGSS